MKLRIKANSNASNRTKNRIRENGEVMTALERDHPTCLNNRESFLFRASNGWLGWIPVDEVDWEKA